MQLMNSDIQQNQAGRVYVQAPIMNHQPNKNEVIDLSEISRFILERKLLVVCITLLFTLIACAYVFIATPIYKSDAALQVESETPPIPGLTALEPIMGGDISSLTEMEIIKSRKVIGAVIDALGLRIHAVPHYFPVIGAGIARLADPLELASAPFNISRGKYAWGGESIRVELFNMDSHESTDAIWHIVKAEGLQFHLLDESERPILTAKVGQSISVDDPVYGRIHLQITNLKGHTGTWFDLALISRIDAIDQVLEQLSVSEKGKKTGIINVTLTGSNLELTKKILDQITISYLKYDVEKKSKEAAQTLSFIQRQLPVLKTEVDNTESALNQNRQKKGAGSVALNLETKAAIDAISELETHLYLLALEKSDLSEKFTALHPSRVAVDKKTKLLKIKKFQLDAQLHKMPEAEWESVKLTRDTNVANELYVMLLNKAQEYKIAKAGVIGNAYILDRAIVRKKPIKPKKILLISIGAFSGLIVALFLAQFLGFRKRNQQGLSSPEEIEQKTGYSVFVSILHSDIQGKLNPEDKKNRYKNKIIARTNPEDLAVESLRSFRTALQFAQIESRNNIIMISGPAPGVGKSFVSVNLAMVLADSGKKVLLIDGDLRKGYLHRYFGINRTPGLSDLVLNQNGFSEVMYGPEKNLRVISTGTIPPNPSEILMSSNFAKFMKWASEHYDLVLIDTPPILSVTDASIVAKHVGTVFMTIRWGMHSDTEIKDAAKRFKQAGIHVNGLILNDIPVNQPTGFNNYHQYQSAYSALHTPNPPKAGPV